MPGDEELEVYFIEMRKHPNEDDMEGAREIADPVPGRSETIRPAIECADQTCQLQTLLLPEPDLVFLSSVPVPPS